MAFYRNPIIEKPPVCIVCSTIMHGERWEDGLICSATCADIWVTKSYGPQYDVDAEELLYN